LISQIDLGKIGTSHFGWLEVEVISAPEAYATLMKGIFDFSSLRELIGRKDFRMVYDSMNGVAGPFVREIFVNQLGAPESSVMNCVPKEDFGGCHPDPNLTYAEELVAAMGVDATGAPLPGVDPKSVPDFGAAADGDADRNMVLGRQFFVTPSDSVAVIAANAQKSIPYFRAGIKGVARSMPTSAALDKVAAKLGLKCYEVPTGSVATHERRARSSPALSRSQRLTAIFCFFVSVPRLVFLSLYAAGNSLAISWMMASFRSAARRASARAATTSARRTACGPCSAGCPSCATTTPTRPSRSSPCRTSSSSTGLSSDETITAATTTSRSSRTRQICSWKVSRQARTAGLRQQRSLAEPCNCPVRLSILFAQFCNRFLCNRSVRVLVRARAQTL